MRKRTENKEEGMLYHVEQQQQQQQQQLERGEHDRAIKIPAKTAAADSTMATVVAMIIIKLYIFFPIQIFYILFQKRDCTRHFLHKIILCKTLTTADQSVVILVASVEDGGETRGAR
jgi:hypothetical protein